MYKGMWMNFSFFSATLSENGIKIPPDKNKVVEKPTTKGLK